MRDILIRPAIKEDMPAVSNVHMICFSDYFLTKLGQSLLVQYYRIFLEDHQLFYVAEADGKIVGFCMGYYAGSRSRERFIQLCKFPLMGRCIRLMIRFDRDTIKRVSELAKEKLLPQKTTRRGETPQTTFCQADLLSIGVLPEFRGTSVAEDLVAAFEKCMKKNGVSRYGLSVKEENGRARAFYEKQGFQTFSRSGDSFKLVKDI